MHPLHLRIAYIPLYSYQIYLVRLAPANSQASLAASQRCTLFGLELGILAHTNHHLAPRPAVLEVDKTLSHTLETLVDGLEDGGGELAGVDHLEDLGDDVLVARRVADWC